MRTIQRTSILLSSVVTGLLSTAAIVGCDVESEPRSATLELDLTRHGIDEVVVEDEGTYALVDVDGHEVGQLARDVDGERVSLSIELRGAAASLSWAPDGEGDAECEPAADVPPGGDPIAACSTELTIAAAITEADGFDVPGFAATEDVGFRSACETINTWVWGHNACQSCYNEAYSQAAYVGHQGGSCSSYGPTTSCSHTFCSGGSQMEMLES